MADILSIIATNYTTVGGMVPSKTPYVAVNAADYQGTWQGKYSTGEDFSFTVSNVNGFRAKVRYQSGSTVKYQDVLIRDASFRIGDSKFMLAKLGKATIKTVVTNPYDGSTRLNTAYATRDGTV
jgi:hypothetical protein